MMPTKETWWQKLVTKPKTPIPSRHIQKWRNLSPDEPPLPFLAPQKVVQTTIKFSELNSNPSEIAPINKDLDYYPSASLYISHEKPAFGRDLYTIPELPEVSTLITDSPAIVPIHDGSCVSPASLEQPQQTRPTSMDEITQPVYSEIESKALFRDMIKSAYLNRHRRPKEMYIVFDANDNIGAIRYVSHDGTNNDQLGFFGPSQYIPPEYASCAIYHQELSDVWALGISLYHMLVGRHPFDETTHLETFRKMQQRDFYIPDTLSPEVKDLLKHMLEPSITQRASFQFIQSHPWLDVSKSKKLFRTLKKVFRIVIKGPFPPPSYYSKKPE